MNNHPAIPIFQMNCRALRHLKRERAFEALPWNSVKSRLVSIGGNAVFRTFLSNRKNEIPVEPIGLVLTRSANCLFHVDNDAIGLGWPDFHIAEQVYDLN